MAYQSLYRRYRSRRFGEIVGQEHVVKALRNAVRDDRVGHAYLFSGPRGTGKTSTARILAKALNCENLTEGEPCCECDSCLAIEAGISYDLQELDAASNNKVEDVRDLISRVALGSPGRTKVYILDEVHMLSAAASNALLKTLEEPPAHVKFVLATTDPHKVLDTIRSRTQHFEFTLLPADALADHVRWVIADGGLVVDEECIAHVLRVGGGSARDTLSALEQVAAAGGMDEREHSIDSLLDALADVDTGKALAAVNAAVTAGRDPRVIGEELLARLRDVFLTRMGATVDHIPGPEQERVADWAERLGDRQTTRALEALGEALLEMRQAPDPRIPLEVALVRLTRASSAGSLEAVIERIERLEQMLAEGAVEPAGGPSLSRSSAAREEHPGHVAAPDVGLRLVPPPAADPAVEPSTLEPSTADLPTGDQPSAKPASRPAGGRPADAARAALAGRIRTDEASRPASPPLAQPGPPPPGQAASPPPPHPSGRGAREREPAPPALRDATSGQGDPPTPWAEAAPPEAPMAAPSTQGAGTGSPPTPVDEPPPVEGALTREGLTLAWADKVLPDLSGLAKAMYGVGRFVEVDGSSAVFALPNEAHRRKCDQRRAEVEAALSGHMGMPVSLRLVVDDGRPGDRPGGRSSGPVDEDRRDLPEPEEDFGSIDIDSLEDAPHDSRDGVARLTDAFPGAQLVDPSDPH